MLRLIVALSAVIVFSVLRTYAAPLSHPLAQVSYAQQTEALINQARSQYGLGPIRIDPRLEASSDFHNKWMADHACFDHNCPGEPPIAERMYAAGYSHNGLGEIIGAGYQLPEDVVAGWMNSPGHRNIILTNYVDFGCAYLFRPGSAWGSYWTCDFAYPGDAYVPPGPTPLPTTPPIRSTPTPQPTPRPTSQPLFTPTPKPTDAPFRPTATAVPPTGGRTAYVPVNAPSAALNLQAQLCAPGGGANCTWQSPYTLVVLNANALAYQVGNFSRLCTYVSCH